MRQGQEGAIRVEGQEATGDGHLLLQVTEELQKQSPWLWKGKQC